MAKGKKLSRPERKQRMEKICSWVNQQIEQEMPSLSGVENATVSQIFHQLKNAISRVKTFKKEEWSFLSDDQWEDLVDARGSMIENRLRQTFGSPPEDKKKSKKETGEKGYFGFIEVMTGRKSLGECLQTTEGRNDLIMAEAMRWGFAIPLNQAIILLTDNPNSPNRIIQDREALAQNLVVQVAKLGPISRQFFYNYISAWVKTNVPDVPENKDFFRDFPKWLEIFKGKVDQKP